VNGIHSTRAGSVRYGSGAWGVAALSQDKFWEQWGAGQTPENKGTEDAKEAEKIAGADQDVLAAWLQALPPNDPLVPAPTAIPAPAASGGDLGNLWPPQAPVDPFAAISPGAGSAADWDLAFDDELVSAPIAPNAEAPADLAGPVPAANPFALPDAAGATPEPTAEAPAPPPISPFGPPPPPPPPPAEVLEALPLKVVITTGRRTLEQTIQGEALIGRVDATRGIHPEIDLRLDDAVSRRHAKIFVKNGTYVLTDLNSTNGTRYNQDWLQPEVEVTLKAGDEIEVGEHTLIRVLEAPAGNA
jgi:hypothetical protein